MKLRLLLSALLLALASPAAEEPIRSIAEFNEFLSGRPKPLRRFELTGLVTHMNGSDQVILSDDSGRALIPHVAQPTPAVGDIVRICGRAEVLPDGEPTIYGHQSTVRLGKGTVPPPTDVTIGELDEREYNLRPVRTSGTIIDAFGDEVDPSNVFLLLKDGGDILPVAVENGSLSNLLSLIDAEVRIDGIFHSTISGIRRFSGPYLGSSNIEIIRRPPADPFAVPALEMSAYLTPREVSRLGKRRLDGTVLAVWQGNQFLLKADDGRVLKIELAGGQMLPQPGAYVTAAGYPVSDLYRMNLARAIIRTRSDASPETPSAQDVTAEQMLLDTHGRSCLNAKLYGQLIRLRGIVRSRPAPDGSDGRILIESGRFTVVVDASPCPDVADRAPPGTAIEVTGICVLDTESQSLYRAFPVVKSVTLVTRYPDDIRIIAAPPWWTPTRLLGVIAALLAALAAFFVRNRILKRIGKLKIGERTRLAVELHDSLSQNLSAIACQVAATRGTLETSPAAVAGQLETVEKMLQSSRTELKRCLWDLRSDALGEKTFDKAIHKALGTLVTQSDVQIRFNVPRNLFDDTDAHAVLSVIRELVANAIAHGQAGRIRIAGDFTDGLFAFSVRDDGRGFDPDLAPGLSEGHFGLQGIRERVKKLKGELAVESAPGGPTRITVRIRHP